MGGGEEVVDAMNEYKNERDPFGQSPERELQRAGVQADPPGPAMPMGAPLRYRTPQYDALVNTYAARLEAAREVAIAHPGARGGKAIAKAMDVTVAMAPTSRNERRRDGRGDQGTRGLEFNEVKTLLAVQRYAMREAIARVFGADVVQEQRGRFRIYAKDGSRAGRGDRRTYTNVPFFIGGARAGTFETMTAEEVG